MIRGLYQQDVYRADKDDERQMIKLSIGVHKNDLMQGIFACSLGQGFAFLKDAFCYILISFICLLSKSVLRPQHRQDVIHMVYLHQRERRHLLQGKQAPLQIRPMEKGILSGKTRCKTP